MNLKSMRAAALEAAQEAQVESKADPENGDLIKAVEDSLAEVKRLDDLIARSAAVTNQFKTLREDAVVDEGPGAQAKSLGEHFVKHAKNGISQIKGSRGTVAAPEFKAPDTIVTGGSTGPMGVVLTEVDRTIVQAPRRPLVTSLFGQGTMNGQAITYFVEGARDGNFAPVAEAGAYAQLDYAHPSMVTDALSKIGGFIRLSDEMLSDLDYLVSEINGRLIYDLSVVEETQVLTGSGTGANLTGLLNRSGVQTGTATDVTLADEIFKSLAKVSNASGLDADALVINPVDYQGLRLAKDSNSQYYGGGYFAGQYGQGGFVEQPPVWGLRTVVSPAVAAGTAVVGAFNSAATLYTKGGIVVEATNSNEDDFTNGLVTVRATKRVALAVRRPAAFVKLTITSS